MEYVHRCVVCDWQRQAGSPTVTPPRCHNCGCVLEAIHAPEIVTHEVPPVRPQIPERVRAGLIRFASIAGAALLLLAAARTGYAQGGPAIAVTAVGAAGLLVSMMMAAQRA